MSKREAKKLMANSNLIDKKGILYIYIYIFSLYKNGQYNLLSKKQRNNVK